MTVPGLHETQYLPYAEPNRNIDKHGPEFKLPIVNTQNAPPLLLIRVPLLEKTIPIVTRFSVFPATVA